MTDCPKLVLNDVSNDCDQIENIAEVSAVRCREFQSRMVKPGFKSEFQQLLGAGKLLRTHFAPEHFFDSPRFKQFLFIPATELFPMDGTAHCCEQHVLISIDSQFNDSLDYCFGSECTFRGENNS